MRNLLMTITFNGAAYHGWQIQENARTVQEVFQESLVKLLGHAPDIKACSRTDTGVHADCFCLSMKLDEPIPAERLPLALNRFLPQDIAVLNCREVAEDFHARYSAKGKRYIYKIWNHPIRSPFLENRAYHYWYRLDEKILDHSARDFIGRHDFTSFCTVAGKQQLDMVREIFDCSVRREQDMVLFTVEGNGFLYNMVRIMTGTLLRIAQGKFSPDSIPSIIQTQDRSYAGPTAPPEGLYLNQVFY